MTYTQESLHLLKADEFKELCFRYIKEWIPEMTDIECIRDSRSQVDIVGKMYGETAVVEIKHKLKISKGEKRDIQERLLNSTYNPKNIILVTSASFKDITDELSPIPSDVNSYLVDAECILSVLNKTKDEIPELKQASKRSNSQKMQLFTAGTAIFSTLMGFYITTTEVTKEKPPLEKRIETVETVIGNLKDLEGQLKYIKEDMVKTQEAKAVIEKEYAKAKELEKLTEQQLESVKEAIRTQSWQEMILQNVLSFILGIASSVVATIGISKYKQRKALED